MKSERELPPVDRYHNVCLEINRSLNRFFRHHVSIRPLHIVLAALQKRDIKWAVLFSDCFKGLVIAGISTKKDIAPPRLQDVR